MKDKLAKALCDAKIMKFGLFSLASGRKSPVYVDVRVLPSFPKSFSLAIDELAKKVKELKVDVVAGAETAGIPLATAISLKTKLPMIYVRKRPKSYGTMEMIEGVLKKDAKVIAGKVYPANVTTNSENGVSDFEKLDPVFEMMEKVGMVACLHGESPDPNVPSVNKESKFLETLWEITGKFPKLKVVLEHVSTKEAVEMIEASPSKNLAATITVHHLFLTLDDVVGEKGVHPHHFCKPIAKMPEDREALRRVIMSGNPKFFLGTDSAPHLRKTKEEKPGSAAGVFSAPVAIPLLVELFEKEGQLEKLESFTSEFGARFYGLPLNKEKITLLREPCIVPKEIHGIVPFWAGKLLNWRVI